MRMQQVSDTLTAAALPFHRLPAINGTNVFSEKTANTRRYLGRDLYSGEVGCYLSHLKAIDKFLESDAEYGLVLEDDAVPASGALDGLTDVLHILSKIPIWDVVNLGQPPKSQRTVLGVEYSGTEVGLCHAHYPPITTTALLWSRGGARAFRLLHSKPIVPIDLALQSWGAETDRILAMMQPLFTAREGQSTIKSNDRRSGGPGPYSVFLRIRRIIRNKLRARHNRIRRRAN